MSALRIENLQPFCSRDDIRYVFRSPFCFEDSLGGEWTAATDGRVFAAVEDTLRWAKPEESIPLQHSDSIRSFLNTIFSLSPFCWEQGEPTPDLPSPKYEVMEDEGERWTMEVYERIAFLDQVVSSAYLRKIQNCAGPVKWMKGPPCEHLDGDYGYYVWAGPQIAGILMPLWNA
ncbi:MAG: hypothetical protein AAGJ81_01525 [Verrucomicrobiota bacterium]